MPFAAGHDRPTVADGLEDGELKVEVGVADDTISWPLDVEML